MNISAIWKLKGAWEQFCKNHPKFPMFIEAVKNKGVDEGTVVSISFTDPDGKAVETNLRITKEDLQLIDSLKDLF